MIRLESPIRWPVTGAHTRFIPTLGFSILLLAVSGCSEGKTTVATVPVSGVVTKGGQPLEGVEVNFIGPEFASIGRTDAQGKYTLIQGAQPGENRVYLVKHVETGMQFNDPEAGMDAGQFEAMMAAQAMPDQKPPEPLIPPEYSDPQKTILKFPVTEEGTTAANFNLP